MLESIINDELNFDEKNVKFGNVTKNMTSEN